MFPRVSLAIVYTACFSRRRFEPGRPPDQKYLVQVSALMACFILAGAPSHPAPPRPHDAPSARILFSHPMLEWGSPRASVTAAPARARRRAGLWAPQLASTTMGCRAASRRPTRIRGMTRIRRLTWICRLTRIRRIGRLASAAGGDGEHTRARGAH